ncbi:Cyclic GMP-AMP synthase [Mizuhopecten yessoensis]|uniref:Cyclic GMP-AMP synthase n=1 Tax=Mizuhopecten yessoensis TaxID=6573 RepID=A0A210Q0Q6_MIZYE|nr:Cyclic GMP-AMP synthase [Mizuhopecten yessoensis]
MADHSEQYEKSWILHHILDRFIGSPELVETRRRRVIIIERIKNGGKQNLTSLDTFYTGSCAEEIEMEGSDFDGMLIRNNVIVLCPFQDSSFPQDSKDKTVFMMRNADCRPGYVTLELVNLVPTCIELIKRSVVPVRDVFYISSEMFRRECADALCDRLDSIVETHGPAACLKTEHCDIIVDGDIVHSFPCTRWPQEAYEWVSRPRQHGWPDKALRDQIVSGGCHLVPVGDKMSDATFLQWRLSFTTAERKLINSLTHTQFLIYGLLKYFLKQISDRLKQIFGDENILSSYIIKTIIFHVVESTPGSVWQEKNTFFCFMLCLKVLIAWVNAGYCPNHFININNMFRGKVQGENPQKLLRLLIDLDDMKWDCLSVGTVIEPSFGILLQSVRNGAWQLVLRPPTESELKCDMEIFSAAFVTDILPDVLAVSLSLLSVSNFGSDEFIAYITTVRALSCTGMEIFEKHIPAKRNKDKYKFIRKSKILMTPLSSVCTSSGLLTLATYHYQSGNYIKTLEMCGQMISSFKIYIGGFYDADDKYLTWYEHHICGLGYSLLHKYKEVCVSNVNFPPTISHFCPSQLHPELTNIHSQKLLSIPPLPYAVFLKFLCYHELGDIRKRDAALIHLRAVKYDKEQGVGHHWIVHTLLGICYEMVGDTRRAIREYNDSLDIREFEKYLNPARKRIERLQKYQSRLA